MTKITKDIIEAGAADATAIPDGAVDTGAIQDDAVTLAKLAARPSDPGKFIGYDGSGNPAALEVPAAAATWTKNTLSADSATLEIMFPAGYDAYEFLVTNLVGSVYGGYPGIQYYDATADDWLTAASSYDWVGGVVRAFDGAASDPGTYFAYSAFADTTVDVSADIDDADPMCIEGKMCGCSDLAVLTQLMWSCFSFSHSSHPYHLRMACHGGGQERTAHLVTGMRLMAPSGVFKAGSSIYVKGIKDGE